ncbi:uncharacterized protein LOC121874536 [Homarus americanus]|uniref:Zinc finger protein 26-like 3 n=1 Tax=Homarus americanus TaxID=6706 RepID=A0A8J5MRW1_HOMAM|nr:uncharacterized protein LOC121874536 [Homarus americanus]KAG7161780.1 Zinc finger protein 26-like 3 [Homarus americanus]
MCMEHTIMAEEDFVHFDEGNVFDGERLPVSAVHTLDGESLVVMKYEKDSFEETPIKTEAVGEILLPPPTDVITPGDHTEVNAITEESILVSSTPDLAKLPTLEVTINHTGSSHAHNTESRRVAVYKHALSGEQIVLSEEEKHPKAPQELNEMLVLDDGNSVVSLQKSVVDEYRRKTKYYGPLKAAVERVKVVQEGKEREVLRTKLMQVKFVSKDASGQDLKGKELLQAVAKIPGLIPSCDPPVNHEEESGNGVVSESEDINKGDMVLISFGDDDNISISKKAIEQYRKLSQVTKPLGVQREKTFKIQDNERIPITIVRLFPSENVVPASSPVCIKVETPQEEKIPKVRRGRPRGRGRGATRGRRRQQPKFLQEYTALQRGLKPKVKEEPESDHLEDTPKSESEDGGISTFGYESGVIVQMSPSYNASETDMDDFDNCDNINGEDILPFQLNSAPVDMSSKLTSNEIWKYLTEYASKCNRVQGLITQFNNESWLEVKRMSDFFHVDGEVMTDVSFKAVYRNDPSPVTYFLRGFSRLIRTGELSTANDINHLFKCLSHDRKLCLGLKPSPYQPDVETNEQVRLYFKQKGQFVSTPFESLFSKACRGIITIRGNSSSTTFTRGSKSILGVHALCSACAMLGKKMNQLMKASQKNGANVRINSSIEKLTEDKYNKQLFRQPIKNKGAPLSSSAIRQIFTQSVAEVLSARVPTGLSNTQDETDLDEEVRVRGKRKKGRKRPSEEGEEEEDTRPSVGVSEEEFLQMIDLRPPNPGIIARSLVKRCNVCQFRAPTMLALFSHMQGHMGTLKEKCSDCQVQLSSKEALETHRKQMHTQRSPMCIICQLDFTTKDQLFDHMNKHRDHHPFECPFCDHKLTNMDAYKKHVRLTHKIKSVRELKLSCKTCNIHFYTRDHLLLHRVNQNHEDIDMFNCKACSSSSVTANEFRSHVLEHTEEEREAANIAICSQCYKVFFSTFKLKFHMETKHNQGKKEPEPVQVEPHTSEPPKKKKNKGPYLRYLRANEKYECHKCRRRFKIRETLENHVKFSHGEKKVTKADFECNQCGRKFNALRRLANHTKIHSGNRPVFQCEECGQIYGKKIQVLEHIRTDHAEQVQRHQQRQELLQSSQPTDSLGDIQEQPQHPVIEGVASASWSPIKSPFKVPTVEQTQEAVYSLLQLTDF